MRPAEFWELTPFELGLCFCGYAEEKKEHRQELIFLAWHVEAFARQKRLVSLKKLLKEDERKEKKQSRLSTDQLMKIAQSKGLKVPRKWR